MWEDISFPDTLVENGVGRHHQINATKICPSGKYPVIDQGQGFIAGYCDDESKLVKEGLPLVVFGDHTRCFKFVDFPFILGADGTKVLKPNPKLFDSKYYYFALLSLDIPSRGYNRHFTLLKETKIPKPEAGEQRRIAYVLSTVQTAIEQQARLIALTRELKSALMRKLFTEGLRSEKQKQTEIGLVPESWDVVRLGELAERISKGSSPRWQGFEYIQDGILFVRSQNVGWGRLDLSDRVFLSQEFNKKEKRSILRNGDILVNLVGASIGRVALGTTEIEGANCNQAVCFVRLDAESSLKEFIVWYLLSPTGQRQMLLNLKDIARANLSLADVGAFNVPLPRDYEVVEIANTFNAIENKIEVHESNKTKLEELFRTLLHQLMTGQIRVKEDIDPKGLRDL